MPENPTPQNARAALARLLENWLERAEEATHPDAKPLEDPFTLASVFGFFRRTDPKLLRSEPWVTMRDRVESACAKVLGEHGAPPSVHEALARIRIQVDRELAEFIQWKRAQTAQQRRNDSPRQSSTIEERMTALRLAERIDAFLLAKCFVLEATPRTPAHTHSDAEARDDGISAQAAMAGEDFHTIERWFSVMERSVDPTLRPTRTSLAHVDALPADRALFDAASWITYAHSRIRLYNSELAEEKAELRALKHLRQFEALQSGHDNNADRWKIAARAPQLNAPNVSRSMRLFQALLASMSPQLAAARSTRTSGGEVHLEWTPEAGARSASCLFDPRGTVQDFIVKFFDEAGNADRSLDGQSASWLGAVASIAEGRARFSSPALLEAASPLDVLRRSMVLFVGGEPWTAELEDEEASS